MRGGRSARAARWVRAATEPDYELHRALGNLPVPTEFRAALAGGDELAVEATIVLKGGLSQRLILERVFTAQQSLLDDLERLGSLWLNAEIEGVYRENNEQGVRAEAPAPAPAPSPSPSPARSTAPAR